MVRMVCPPINPSAGPGACWSEAVDYSKHWSQSTQLRSSSPSNSTQSLDLRLSGKIQGGPHTRRRSLEDIPTFHARFVRKFCQDYSAWKDGTLCMLHCLESRSIKTGNFPEWIFSTLQHSRLFLHSRQRTPLIFRGVFPRTSLFSTSIWCCWGVQVPKPWKMQRVWLLAMLCSLLRKWFIMMKVEDGSSLIGGSENL